MTTCLLSSVHHSLLAAATTLVQKEVSSLSCEPWEGGELVVSLFEVPANTASIAAFIEREHEFRFLAVHPTTLQGQSTGRVAVSHTACPLLHRCSKYCVMHVCRWLHGLAVLSSMVLQPSASAHINASALMSHEPGRSSCCRVTCSSPRLHLLHTGAVWAQRR